MYEGDKLLRLYSATGSLSFSRSSRSSFSMASSIDGSVAFLFLNFLDTAILIMTLRGTTLFLPQITGIPSL